MILCLPAAVKINSNLFRALLRFLPLLLAVAPALGQVYRWIDESGVTHYGERPPQGAKAQEVQDRLANPASTVKVPAESWQDKDRELRQRRIQSEQAEERKAQADSRRRQFCNEQRDLLARLKQSGRTYRLDSKGERVYLEDNEREAAIARQEKIVAQQCQS